ncbi:SEC12-like protein 2 [Hordeum vulgare]|nr:SEC12-like protein 2 [Hordeum vulgare]
MKMVSSSSSGSRSLSVGSPALLPVKPELQETPLGWRTRNRGIVINELNATSRLVKPKTEPGLLPVKQEHLTMAADDETALKWDNYIREEMERQRRALEEIVARRRAHEEDGVVILDDNDEEVPGPCDHVRQADPVQGCSKDDGGAQDDDDNDDDNDYINFYKLLLDM